MTASEAITSLLNRYATTVDTGDFEGFLALFEHAEWAVEGLPPNRGRDAIHENILAKIVLYEDGTPKTRHVTTNVELDIDEAAGTATGERYVTVLQATDTLPLQPIFSGHYHDAFVREDGQWRFASTLVRNPLVGDMSHHLQSTAFIDGD